MKLRRITYSEGHRAMLQRGSAICFSDLGSELLLDRVVLGRRARRFLRGCFWILDEVGMRYSDAVIFKTERLGMLCVVFFL
jgi:hypothetical protein